MRPALAEALNTLTILFWDPFAHAKSRPAGVDSTAIVTVDRLDQVINAVQADEVRTQENGEFFAQGMATCLRGAFQFFAPEL